MAKNLLSVVVLISGSGTNLQALIDACPASNYQITAVISNDPKALGLERAKKSGIETLTIEQESFSSRAGFDSFLASTISRFNPSLIVLAGFMRILGHTFVKQFHGRIINIHPSLLPTYPGLNTHQRVIKDKKKVHGVTVHYVTEALDGGPIIAQEEVPILSDDTAEALAARVLKKEHVIYPKVVNLIALGKIQMKNGEVIFDKSIL